MTQGASPAEWEKELTLAREARLRGNEGRARVCARRAAGFSARIYLQARGIHVRGNSVLSQLVRLAELPETGPKTRQRIQLLLLKVDPEFRLPVGTDLIAEAEALCEDLVNSRTP